MKSSGSSQLSPGPRRDSALRALDKALRDALGAAPRDDVMQHVAAAFADELPEGQDQRDVVAAIQRQARQDRLGKLLDELEVEHGPVPEAIREQARRMWPNYEDDE